MNENIIDSSELWKVGEKLKTNDDLRLQIHKDPIGFLKSYGIDVEEKFVSAVRQSLELLTVENGTSPLSKLEDNNCNKADISNSVFKVKSMASDGRGVADSADKMRFYPNGWGLVLVIPESQLQLIYNGGYTVKELGAAIMAGLVAAAVVFPPLAALGLFAGAVAVWILAELVAIKIVDSVYRKGVNLTWTWIGLALTCYLPIPGAIS